MKTQRGRLTGRQFPIAAVLIVMGIAGVLATIIGPQFTGVHSGREPSRYMQSALQTIRSNMELYNRRHPEAPYDATTPVGPAFWDPLLQRKYLSAAPTNPLQDHSALVVASPMEGAGWVWAESPWPLGPEFSGTFIIWAIDEDGNLYDGDRDGWPD